jgi:hypothetical protein
VESATQTLHRLTSVERYDEAREVEPPVDDPGVVQGFTPMDLNRLPWFYKRYHDGLPRIDLPRRLTATNAGPQMFSPAPHTHLALHWTCPDSAACCSSCRA